MLILQGLLLGLVSVHGFLRLPSGVKVRLVENEADLLDFCANVRLLTTEPPHNKDNQLNMVGVDCEWRPENYQTRVWEQSETAKALPRLLIALAGGITTKRGKFIERFYLSFIARFRNRKTSSSKKRKRGPSSSPVHVLQVSTRSTVWVLDLLELVRQVPSGTGRRLISSQLTSQEALLDDAFSSLFRAEHILKVGLGPQQDLKRLGWSYPWLPSTLGPYKAVVDVQSLAKSAFPGVPTKEIEGLSKLCLREFGEGVSKEQQCSDWAQRPLSAAQIDYAALDAAVLIQLCDALVERASSSSSKGARKKPPLEVIAPLVSEYKMALPQTQEDVVMVGAMGVAVDAEEEEGEKDDEDEDEGVALRAMIMTTRPVKGWAARMSALLPQMPL
jgi:hypothetical protein